MVRVTFEKHIFLQAIRKICSREKDVIEKNDIIRVSVLENI